MDKYKYSSELPYPEFEFSKNLYDAKLLMPNYCGAHSELTATMTYLYQSYIKGEDEIIAKILKKIAISEMHHHSILGNTIFKLGGYPVIAGKTYWNGNMVNYTMDTKSFLRHNILAEESGILNYEKTILHLKTEEVKITLERIILDEEIHIKILKDLLNNY